MTVICYYCRQDRSGIRSQACPNFEGKHYFVRQSDPKTDHAQRVIPRLDARRNRFEGQKAALPIPDDQNP